MDGEAEAWQVAPIPAQALARELSFLSCDAAAASRLRPGACRGLLPRARVTAGGAIMHGNVACSTHAGQCAQRLARVAGPWDAAARRGAADPGTALPLVCARRGSTVHGVCALLSGPHGWGATNASACVASIETWVQQQWVAAYGRSDELVVTLPTSPPDASLQLGAPAVLWRSGEEWHWSVVRFCVVFSCTSEWYMQLLGSHPKGVPSHPDAPPSDVLARYKAAPYYTSVMVPPPSPGLPDSRPLEKIVPPFTLPLAATQEEGGPETHLVVMWSKVSEVGVGPTRVLPVQLPHTPN